MITLNTSVNVMQLSGKDILSYGYPTSTYM